MIKVMEIKTDKSREPKKAFPLTAMAAICFGAVEIMKQGFAESGNCWIMAVGVVALVWGIWRANK